MKLTEHGRRRDLPCRPGAEAPGDTLEEAVERLERDKYSSSERQSTTAQVNWWLQLSEVHKGAPWPLTWKTLRGAAAVLKARGYRSASQCLYTMKREHCVQGHKWSTRLALEMAGCKRSCARGIGPARQADPLRLTPSFMSGAYTPCSLLSGREAIVVGSWWLLREAELASLRRKDVSLVAGTGCGVAIVGLAASKTDPTARGVTRTLGCACPSTLCPVKAVRAVLARCAGAATDAFVVRNLTGEPCTKAEVVAEAQQVARVTGTSGWVTGHSMRVTGAQRLALAGVGETRVITFGRWSGMVFRRYVREAVLGVNGGDLSAQVEQALIEKKVYEAFEARHAARVQCRCTRSSRTRCCRTLCTRCRKTSFGRSGEPSYKRHKKRSSKWREGPCRGCV